MKSANLTLGALIDGLEGLTLSDPGAAGLEIAGLASDSREVKPGFLFAALKGVAADGRDFVPQAIEKGAVAILTHADGAAFDIPTIRAEAPRRALALMTARVFPRQPETAVAVTGTNGKSSTVDFLRQIWAADGRASASVGTLGVATSAGLRPLGHTTPDPIAVHEALDRLAGEGVTHVALEASSHGLAQHRLDGMSLTAVGFTNLTQDHLDYHPDFDDYFAAKLRLFEELCPAGAPAVINPDGEWGARAVAAARGAGLDTRTFGWSGENLRLLEITPRAAEQLLLIVWDGKERKILLPLAGEFQALNALGACLLAIATGVAPEAAFGALAHLTGVRGRLERVAETAEGAPVFVDYAHTPDGLDKALRALRPHTQGKLMVVFGCGGDRDPVKRPLMGAIAEKLADAAIVTDDNPRSEAPDAIRAAILNDCPSAREIGDRAEAIAAAVEMLRAGDALVIAGKGHETGQIIGDRVIPFDDAEKARRACGVPA
ncbi:MAG: UDP-N-acetylmuramoyl-L-alanyl-D-glutamate--2,6-diaminopimelate ligase [Maricaulaceae bacterium]|jgi:UDP-N-acetylmuramoyl-L-alanyl-D-glutamate--2,6-diaminopimelate ligase